LRRTAAGAETVLIEKQPMEKQQDLNDSLDNLGNYQTNKDQTLGSVIAKAAFLISQGAHLVRETPATTAGTTAEQPDETPSESQDN
jgi:hypothetical protein